MVKVGEFYQVNKLRIFTTKYFETMKAEINVQKKKFTLSLVIQSLF